MKYYEIQLPVTTNDGQSYMTEMGEWTQFAVELCGGLSVTDVAGVWKNEANGVLQVETMSSCRIAASPAQFAELVAKAKALFSDQSSFFTAELGEATFYNGEIHADAKGKPNIGLYALANEIVAGI